MPELSTENTEKEGWVYVGRKSNGEPKFRKFTNQTMEYVKEYLDSKGIVYFVHEAQCLFFIYKEKEPKSRYSPRYSYYYTTGQWGGDKRRKHYHSDGIEHFIENYYRTVEQDKEYWESKDKDAV